MRKVRVGLMLVTCLIPCAAGASTIQANLNADFVAATTGAFEISGPSLSLYSGTSDWTSSSLECQQGAVCDATLTIPASVTAEGLACWLCSGGSLGSLDANALTGTITFTGSVFVPVSSGPYLAVTFPVAISGDIQGWQAIYGYGLVDELFTVGLSGSGTGGLVGVVAGNFVFFYDGGYTATVTADATPNVPEPGTVSLLALGSLALGFWRMRKARAARERDF
jgi:hypothetical protein